MSFVVARAVWRALMLSVAGLLAIQVSLTAAGISTRPTVARAQPAPELSVEDATLALLPYQLADTELPPGYTSVGTRGYSNEAQAFELASPPEADPRPASQLVQPLVQSGRVVILRQFLEKSGDPDAAELRYSVAYFATPQGASRALEDPSLLTQVLPDEQLTPTAAPTLGDGAARFHTYADDEYADRLIWRRGNLVFTVASFGSEAVVTAAEPVVADLATRADRRFASLPALPAIGPAPAYMPNVERRLELYHALLDRILPDEAFPDTELASTAAISNAILLFDTTAAQPPLIDTHVVYDRLVRGERRILGISRLYEAPEDRATPAGSFFPAYAVGYHLYADAGGAGEAMIAPPAEVALRIGNELSISVTTALSDATPVVSLGDQPRAMTGRWQFDDGVEIDIVTLRWRRGAVELFVDAAVAAGSDVSATVRRLAEQLDAAYIASPLPGF